MEDYQHYGAVHSFASKWLRSSNSKFVELHFAHAGNLSATFVHAHVAAVRTHITVAQASATAAYLFTSILRYFRLTMKSFVTAREPVGHALASLLLDLLLTMKSQQAESAMLVRILVSVTRKSAVKSGLDCFDLVGSSLDMTFTNMSRIQKFISN